MHASRPFHFMVAACLIAAVRLSAGESGSGSAVPDTGAVPPFVSVHISIRAPAELLKKIDAFAVKATKGTKYPLPPGTMIAAANMMLPALFGNIGDIEDFHIALGQSPMFWSGPLLVFRTGGFEQFLDKLRDSGVTITERPDNRLFPGVDAVVPGLGDIALADAGDGLIAAARKWTTLDTFGVLALLRWRPVHEGDADIAISYHAPEEWSWRRTAETAIGWMRDRELAYRRKIERLGINPDMADGAVRLVEKYAPVFFAELHSVRKVSLELNLSEDGVRAAANIDSIPESMPARFARLTDHAQLEPPALGLDADLLSLARGKSSGFLGSISGSSADMLDHMASLVFPSMRHRLKDTLAVLLQRRGEYAWAARRGKDAAYHLTWWHEPETDRYIAAVEDLFDILRDMLNEAVIDARAGVETEKARKTSPGGHSYAVVSLAPKDSAGFAEFCEKLSKEVTIPGWAAREPRTFVLYLGGRDGALVLGQGDLAEADFVAALDGPDPLSVPTHPSLAVANAVAAIRHRQLLAGVVNFDAALAEAAWILANRADRERGSTLYRRTLGQVQPDQIASGEFIAFGLGARGDLPVAEASVTAGAVRAVLKNLDIFEKALREDAPAPTE